VAAQAVVSVARLLSVVVFSFLIEHRCEGAVAELAPPDKAPIVFLDDDARRAPQ
jgi:hypothetical protein